MRVIVDSSVWAAALKPRDSHHKVSNEFFAEALKRHDELYAPCTLLWEIDASLAHPQKLEKFPLHRGDRRKWIMQYYSPAMRDALRQRKLIPIDQGLFDRTMSLVCSSVKGADRIFISCALDKNGILISWDQNQVKRASDWGVKAGTPQAYLQGNMNFSRGTSRRNP